MINNIDEFISFVKNKKEILNNLNLFSFIEPIDGIDLVKLLNKFNNFFYWKSPEFNIEFLALDPLVTFDSKDYNKPDDLENALLSFKNKRINNFENYNNLEIPVFVGAIKFDFRKTSEIWSDYSNESWFIPKFLLIKKNNGTYLVTNFNAHLTDTIKDDIDKLKRDLTLEIIEHSEESKIEYIKNQNEDYNWWKDSIFSILNFIKDGRSKKVVISREMKVSLSQPPIISNLLSTLDKRFPKCFKFAYKRYNSTFFGASPEKILTLKNNVLHTDALAGSMPRHNDEKKDLEYQNQLLNNPKDLNEHNTVVQYIVDTLKTFTSEITFSEKPGIKKLRNIQHLYTPIKAKLNNGNFILKILRTIHPTPAICGFPCDKSKEIIFDLEKHDRGLFTGAIGWANFENEGEFSVAIRSALVRDKNLYAYAGCGIVPGSEPELEFKETNLKFNSILNLFNKDEI